MIFSMLSLGKKDFLGVIQIYSSHFPSSHLSHNNIKVLDHAIWCLTYCAEVDDNRRRIRITGAIPLLLSLLENG
jgi:hypothetical protein